MDVMTTDELEIVKEYLMQRVSEFKYEIELIDGEIRNRKK